MTAPRKRSVLRGFLAHWGTWAVVGLLSSAIYLGIWPLFYNFVILPKAAPGKHGLQVYVFERPELKGTPALSFINDSDKLTLKKPDTSLLAYGLWKAPQTGLYRMRLECDDFGSLNLDGQDLIQLTGTNARNIGEIEGQLEVGYHLLVLRLFNGPGQGWVTLNRISPQRRDSLLSGTSLLYLDFPNLYPWLTFVKRAEKMGLVLMIISLGVLILMVSIYSVSPQKEIHSQGRISLLRITSSIKNRSWEEPKKFVLVFFLVTFVFLGLYYQYHLYRQAIPRQTLGYFRDPVTLFEQRLQEIKPFLPSRGTIGFLSDRDDPADFFQTQYALSPLLVTKDSGPDLVLGIIYDPAFLQKPHSLKDLRINREFQNGLILLERTVK
jgi:hypothetical protein